MARLLIGITKRVMDSDEDVKFAAQQVLAIIISIKSIPPPFLPLSFILLQFVVNMVYSECSTNFREREREKQIEK